MKEDILRSAARIISRDGAKAASIRAICEHAGVTAPTIYHYFNDREGLFAAVTLMAFEKNRKIKKVRQHHLEPIDELRMAWDEYVNFAFTDPELCSIMISSVTQGQIPSCGIECFNETIHKFKTVEKLGLLKFPARESAMIYQGAAQGVMTLVIARADAKELHQLSMKTREIVLSGLLRAEK